MNAQLSKCIHKVPSFSFAHSRSSKCSRISGSFLSNSNEWRSGMGGEWCEWVDDVAANERTTWAQKKKTTKANRRIKKTRSLFKFVQLFKLPLCVCEWVKYAAARKLTKHNVVWIRWKIHQTSKKWKTLLPFGLSAFFLLLQFNKFTISTFLYAFQVVLRAPI